MKVTTKDKKPKKQQDELVEIDLKDFNQDKERIWIIRETPGGNNKSIVRLSINRQIVDGLIRECQVSSSGLGKNNNNTKRQVDAQFKAVETTTCHVCPKCHTEAELRWKVEVEESQANQFDVVVRYLQRQEKRQNKQMQQEIKQLKAEKKELKDANKAAKEAFEALNNFAKKRTAENTQLQQEKEKSKEELEATSLKWKKRWEKQKEENKNLKTAMEQLRAKYRTLARQLREICPTPSFKL